MTSDESINRRRLLKRAGLAASALTLCPVTTLLAQSATRERRTRVAAMEVLTVAVTGRTNWILVRLTTNNGLSGIGEASLGRRSELAELNAFFAMVEGESPFAIQQYRMRGRERAAAGNRVVATAFSAIEQALWDIVGKSLQVPVYQMFGGKLRDSLPLYANINRATSQRTPAGFADNAEQAVADGFRAIKAAPFDGFPPLTAAATEITRATDLGIACVYAMRESIGDDVQLKIDAHSFFDVALAIEVASQLQAAKLSWYEEPVAPTQTENTATIHAAIEQTLAGGEFLFGIEGFGPLCEIRALDIIMPDVKHCGGLLEAQKISALAEYAGIGVSPHNPSGPVSTAVSVQLCAALPNFEILEFQWGESAWRSELVTPAEEMHDGNIQVSEAAGIGIELNDRVLNEHRL